MWTIVYIAITAYVAYRIGKRKGEQEMYQLCKNADQVVNVILADISAFKERYNQFAVVEGTTFTLLNGEYEYKVYAQTSAVNTNPDLANELVETGILKCQLVEQPEVFYSPA